MPYVSMCGLDGRSQKRLKGQPVEDHRCALGSVQLPLDTEALTETSPSSLYIGILGLRHCPHVCLAYCFRVPLHCLSLTSSKPYVVSRECVRHCIVGDDMFYC